jgi:hypothetical protein
VQVSGGVAIPLIQAGKCDDKQHLDNGLSWKAITWKTASNSNLLVGSRWMKPAEFLKWPSCLEIAWTHL